MANNFYTIFLDCGGGSTSEGAAAPWVVEVKAWMNKEGFSKPSELVGLAHEA